MLVCGFVVSVGVGVGVDVDIEVVCASRHVQVMLSVGAVQASKETT